MTPKEAKNTWNTVVEVLRLFTPVLLSVLSYLVLGFQNTLQENTKAINDVRLQMATFSQKLEYVEGNYYKLENRLEKIEASIIDDRRRITIIETQSENRKR